MATELLASMPIFGELTWIGIRPGRKQPLVSVNEVFADEQFGLVGDHYQVAKGKRQVTLIQWEHLDQMQSLLHRPIKAELLRRNLVIKGMDLLALKNQPFRIGQVIFQGTGKCHPCSRMNELLGADGFKAVCGRGGLTAQIIRGGFIQVGDKLTTLCSNDLDLKIDR
jgi:MOSC domain-containing protein YiiM